MKETNRLIGMLGFALCGALVGDNAYGAVSVSVGVEIRAQSDFYEPLTPYGEWVAIGSYGRCWRPSRMEAGWRPYCNGYWQRTDAGWYWASDEPWGWATYHYGRWGFTDEYGWYWVPQTEWAPAWVSWHTGGGYIGWAPLYTSDVRVIAPRAYVFVEERHFMEPVRSSTVVVNNTTIISQTVIHEAPAIAVVEKASGRKIQALPVQQVRYKAEAPVVAKQKTATATGARNVQTPVGNEAQPAAKKAVTASAPSQVEKPGATPRAPAPLPPTGRVSEGENFKPIPSQPAPRPVTVPPAALKEPIAPKAVTNVQPSKNPVPKVEKAPGKPLPPAPEKVNGGENFKPIPAQPESRPVTAPPAALKEPAAPKAVTNVQPSKNPVPKVEKAPGKPLPPAPEKVSEGEKNGKPAGEPHSQKAEEHQTPPEKPVVPPGAP